MDVLLTVCTVLNSLLAYAHVAVQKFCSNAALVAQFVDSEFSPVRCSAGTMCNWYQVECGLADYFSYSCIVTLFFSGVNTCVKL